MTFKLASALMIPTCIFSGCVTTGTNQDYQIKSIRTQLDSKELASIENEVQELKNRILKLEAKLSSIKDSGESATPTDSWKTLNSWRKLKAGMDYESVEKILGPAHRIDGGIIANWYYENGGRANFYDGKLQRWEEPD